MWTMAVALSYHIGTTQSLNWAHPHFRYTTDDQYIAGAYYNSDYEVSLYAGKKFGNLELAVVSGYDNKVLPYVRYVFKEDYFVAPALYANGSKGLVIGYEIKL